MTPWIPLISPDNASYPAFAAAHLLRIMAAHLEHHPTLHLCLTGGSTPRALHAEWVLQGRDFPGHPFPWHRVLFYFGDERAVPPDHPDSNFRMARETLFEPLGIPMEQVARMRGEGHLEAAAQEYEARLRARFGDEVPRFDLLLLGMGEDGHCASLFPHTSALLERERYVVVNPVEKLGTERLTLTYPVLNAARSTVFLVTGAKKESMLKTVMEGPFDPQVYPSQAIQPTNGPVQVLVDPAAMGKEG